MGSSWNDVLQALVLGLAIQMIASVVCVICACLWRSLQERMACPPAGGEPMAESDLEMGTVTGGEGIDRPSGFAANRSTADCEDAHHQGKLERTADTGGLQNGTVVPGERASEQDVHIPPIKADLPKVQFATMAPVTEDETRASVPVVVDDSHTQQVEVLAGNINEAPAVQGVQDGQDGMLFSITCRSSSFSAEAVVESAPGGARC